VIKKVAKIRQPSNVFNAPFKQVLFHNNEKAITDYLKTKFSIKRAANYHSVNIIKPVTKINELK